MLLVLREGAHVQPEDAGAGGVARLARPLRRESLAARRIVSCSPARSGRRWTKTWATETPPAAESQRLLGETPRKRILPEKRWTRVNPAAGTSDREADDTPVSTVIPQSVDAPRHPRRGPPHRLASPHPTPGGRRPTSSPLVLRPRTARTPSQEACFTISCRRSSSVLAASSGDLVPLTQALNCSAITSDMSE